MDQMTELLRPEAETCVLRARQNEASERVMDYNSDYSDVEAEQLEAKEGDEWRGQYLPTACELSSGEVKKAETFISQAKGEDARQPQNPKKDFQAKVEDARQPPFAEKQPCRPGRGKWAEVKETMIKITRARLKELSQDGDDRVSPAQESYIGSLTNPDVYQW